MGELFGVCGLIQGAVLVAGISSSHTVTHSYFLFFGMSSLVAVLLGPVSDHQRYCEVFSPHFSVVDIWVSRLRRPFLLSQCGWNRFHTGHKTHMYNQDLLSGSTDPALVTDIYLRRLISEVIQHPGGHASF